MPHDIGVLPRRRGEESLLGLIERILRDYRSHRSYACCFGASSNTRPFDLVAFPCGKQTFADLITTA